jgi:BarA-like signal transduction histidine kinase
MGNFDLGNYIDVAERLRELYVKHPNARVVTEIVEHTGTRVTVKASVYRDAKDTEPAGVDYSSMAIPGSTPYTKGSELENASTSATGRAIVLAGLPSKRVASADELKAKGATEERQIAQAAQELFGNAPAPQAAAPGELGNCPDHGKAYRMGKFGPHCATKNADGTWCKRRPAAKAQPAPEENLENLPF